MERLMPSSTTLFQLFPWVGGLNLSADDALIQPNQLTRAENVIFGVQGTSRKKREGINFDWDSATSGSSAIIGGVDFWYGDTTKTQKKVAIFNDKTVCAYASDTGTRTANLFGGAAWSDNV